MITLSWWYHKPVNTFIGFRSILHFFIKHIYYLMKYYVRKYFLLCKPIEDFSMVRSCQCLKGDVPLSFNPRTEQPFLKAFSLSMFLELRVDDLFGNLSSLSLVLRWWCWSMIIQSVSGIYVDCSLVKKQDNYIRVTFDHFYWE